MRYGAIVIHDLQMCAFYDLELTYDIQYLKHLRAQNLLGGISNAGASSAKGTIIIGAKWRRVLDAGRWCLCWFSLLD